ncbi:MAG TPA: Spy/CpxP family protein refolding chaperone [Stellaceae bacterium]|nr:Spy/CpxP family protein refolding chaperone [Stellaceae bacterium]
MPNCTVILSRVALATLIAGAALVPLALGAEAQTAAPAAQAGRVAAVGRYDPARSLESRIAQMKTELNISDAQAPQFERVAEAMRGNAKEMAQLRQEERTSRGQPQSAIDLLAARQRYDALRAAEAQRLLDAFTPLYQNLTDAQKKTADALLAPHPRRPT